MRGINVGGTNIIKMTALQASFEHVGFSDVKTYIQSGNVIFNTQITTHAQLERMIENALAHQFQYKSRVVVISRDTLVRIVAEAPKGFGTKPTRYRYDVIFLKEPLTPRKAMKAVETKDAVDSAFMGKHALYFSRLTDKATQSHLPKLVQKPEYQYMTIRNWNTTSTLLLLMDADK